MSMKFSPAAYARRWKQHLARSAAWRECAGCRHVLVLSRGVMDYWTQPTSGGGGGFAIDDPFWRNVHKLTIDAAAHPSWPSQVRRRLRNVHAVPWPSGIHPRDAAELARWQRYVASARRQQLLTQ